MTRPSALDVLVDIAAVYRVTRAVTRDSVPLTRIPRDAVRRRWPDSDAATLVTCDWCVSVWAGFAVTAARALTPRAWDPIARALAASAVTGIVASRIE